MKKLTLILAMTVLAVGCRSMSDGPSAVATLDSRSGSNARGTVWFMEMPDGAVRVKVDLTGVAPGVHGFHVHEKGDCSAPDATSAGGHFNPAGAPHGPHASGSHAGDFGNVTAGANGEIHIEFITRSVTVSPGDRSVVGKGVVLHGAPDDLTSQPSGNAGSRIACGVATLSS